MESAALKGRRAMTIFPSANVLTADAFFYSPDLCCQEPQRSFVGLADFNLRKEIHEVEL
jgi:hypothetical protein